MFFTLSKILIYLIYPLTWIFILWIWMFITKNTATKKRLAICSFILLVLFSNGFIYKKIALSWQSAPVQIPLSQTYSAAIVLGGYESYDKNGKGYFNESSDRFIQTLKFYRQNTVKKIILSGAKVEKGKPQKTDFLREQLLRLGVPANDIIIEDSSKNTFENAVDTKKILDTSNMKPPYVLITSAVHMPRAQKVFTRQGIRVVPFPCDYQVLPTKVGLDDFIPASEVLNGWSTLLKEMIGTLVYKMVNKA